MSTRSSGNNQEKAERTEPVKAPAEAPHEQKISRLFREHSSIRRKNQGEVIQSGANHQMSPTKSSSLRPSSKQSTAGRTNYHTSDAGSAPPGFLSAKQMAEKHTGLSFQ